MFQMKVLFILEVLLFLSGLKADDSSSFENEKYEKFDDVYGGIIDSDSEDDKILPCELTDWQCIRMFLASNSDCQPSYGPILDPLNLPVDKFYIPAANLTITHTDLEIRGLRSARISEFYVNKATGNLVIAINVKNLNQTSPKSYFTYQRARKEPVIRSDFTMVTYDSATFTAVIPKIPHLRLDRAEIHADIHDGTPVFAIGSGANSTDPDVMRGYQLFIDNIPSAIQEAFVFQSSLLTSIYIQMYLCDFGLDSYRNYLTFVRTKGNTQVPGGVYDIKKS